MKWTKWAVLGLAGAMFVAPVWTQAAEKHVSKASASALPEAKTQDLYAGNSLKRWMPKAERGDIFAQYVLGHMYCVGQGVPKDLKTGMSWYQRAADQGFAPGQLALGTMYYNGEGVPQNYKLAAKWFRLAAESGYDRAQNNLAAMYLNGQGVPKDYKQAIKWLRAAADQGYASAQYALGMMYLNGTGMKNPDRVAAYGLLRPLVDKGDPAAVTAMKELLPKMSQDQIKHGQALAEQIRGKNRLNKALDAYEKIAMR